MQTRRILTRYGDMVVPANDTFIGRSLIEYGEWTHSEIRLIEQILRPGMTVLDVGANIGSHTLAFSKIVGPHGRVVAFEPQPFMFRLLATNVTLNDAANVVLFNAAVGEAPGWLDLPSFDYAAPGNYGAISLGSYVTEGGVAPHGLPIPVFALDDLQAVTGTDVIKVDVEQMEAFVIEGARRLVSARRPLLYVENEVPGPTSEAAIGKLMAMDYDLYWHYAPLFEPENFKANRQNVFADIVCINMVALPRERAISVVDMKKIERVTDHPRIGV